MKLRDDAIWVKIPMRRRRRRRRRPIHTVDPLSPIFMPVFLDNEDFGFIPSQSFTDPHQTLDMIFIFHLLFIYKNNIY